MSCSCSSCARRRDESLWGKGGIEWSRRESTTYVSRRTSNSTQGADTFRESDGDRFFIHGPSTSRRNIRVESRPAIYFRWTVRPCEIFTSSCVLALGTPRCVRFASLHAARHRTNRSSCAYIRGDLAMVRATRPARASPRAFAKRAAAPRLPDSRFLSLAAFSRRDVAKTQRASTGASSRGETRARRNESARVLRVPAPRARATLVHSTTYRAPLTEAHPPNRARTR